MLKQAEADNKATAKEEGERATETKWHTGYFGRG